MLLGYKPSELRGGKIRPPPLQVLSAFKSPGKIEVKKRRVIKIYAKGLKERNV